MKKIIFIGLVVITTFFLVSCGNENAFAGQAWKSPCDSTKMMNCPPEEIIHHIDGTCTCRTERFLNIPNDDYYRAKDIETPKIPTKTISTDHERERSCKEFPLPCPPEQRSFVNGVCECVDTTVEGEGIGVNPLER